MSGDPSPITSYGVYMGMKATAKRALGQRQPERQDDRRAGRAARWRITSAATCTPTGAKLIVTDIDAEKVKRAVEEFGAQRGGARRHLRPKADIYAPCALGATINDETLHRLKVEIIAGAANNQLARGAPRPPAGGERASPTRPTTSSTAAA